MAKTEFSQVLSSTSANSVYYLKTENDIIVGTVSLEEGGDINKHIADLQEFIFEITDIVGIVGELDPNAKIYLSNNYITDGDNRKVTIGKLDTALKVRQDNIDALTIIVDLNKLVLTSDLAIAASGTITQNLLSNRQKAMVAGNAGPQTLSTTPFGSGSFKDGLEITIIGTDDVNTIEVLNTDIQYGTLLADTATLGKGESITVVYDLTLERFIEKGRNI